MKTETMRMLEEWKNDPLRPTEGIIISKEYSYEDNSIELDWFLNYTVGGLEHVINYALKNLPDDIDSLNLHIGIVEKNNLVKLIQKH